MLLFLRHIPSSQNMSEMDIFRVWSLVRSLDGIRRRSGAFVRQSGNIMGRIMMAALQTFCPCSQRASDSVQLGSRQCRHAIAVLITDSR